MTASSFDWDDELPPETEDEVYRALLRALQRKQGFGLFFVQCSKVKGEKIVADLRRDLRQQQIQELHLQGEVVTLYDQISDLWQKKPFDVLVVEGLQASLYAYEDTKRFSGWSSRDIYHYSWKGVPKILNHLNQQREHLRNDFPARFVFFVPPFVVDYFIQRAADFLDWRSGLFRFPHNPNEAAEEVDRLVSDGDYDKYFALTPQERVEKILTLKTALQSLYIDSERQVQLLSELGLLFAVEQDYENAVTSYDKAIEIKPDYYQAWNARGRELEELGRYEEAIASYDQALKLKPGLGYVWRNRGQALNALGNHEEALASFNKALRLRPDDNYAWYFRGDVLRTTKQYEEALASYDNALKIKPDKYAWRRRGLLLEELNQYQEAIYSFEKALEIDSDYIYAWNDRGRVLGRLKQTEETVKNFDQALESDSSNYYLWHTRGVTLYRLKVYEEALTSLDKALKIKPPSGDYANLYYVWKWRGFGLNGLKRYQEAIISFDKALAFKPDIDFFDRYYTLMGRSLAFWRLSQYQQAIESFYQAVVVVYGTLQKAKLDSYRHWLRMGANILLRKLRLRGLTSTLTALFRQWFKRQTICDFDAALKYSPDDYEAWHNLGNALERLKCYTEALTSYDKALTIKSDYYEAWDCRGDVLVHLKHYEDSIKSYDRAIAINPEYQFAWERRGLVLSELGQFEAAHESYDRAISLNPDDARAYYYKACCYGLQKNLDLAIETLQHAINLNSENRELAKTDSDFDGIRDDERFRAIVGV